MRWWFSRKPQLLDRFLELEERRLSNQAALEEKRNDLEIRKLEIELTHVKARTEAQVELEKARAELREKRRTSARKAATVRWNRERGVVENGEKPSCPLCINPAFSRPTVAMIRDHDAHSQSAMSEFLANTSKPEPEQGN